MKKSVNITLALSLALSAWTPYANAKGGGNGPGHGGDVVACFNSVKVASDVRSTIIRNRKIQAGETQGVRIDPLNPTAMSSIKSLDLLEFYELDQRTQPRTPQRDIESIERDLRALTELAYEKNIFLGDQLTNLANNILPIRKFNFSQSGLVEVDDSNEKILLPEECLLLQIGVQDSLGTVTIDSRLFDRLDYRHQVALIQHERLWPLVLSLVKNDHSTRLRRLNQFLFSEDFRFLGHDEIFQRIYEVVGYLPGGVQKYEYKKYKKIFDRWIALGKLPNIDYETITVYQKGIPEAWSRSVQMPGWKKPLYGHQSLNSFDPKVIELSGYPEGYRGLTIRNLGSPNASYYESGPNPNYSIYTTFSYELGQVVKVEITDEATTERYEVTTAVSPGKSKSFICRSKNTTFHVPSEESKPILLSSCGLNQDIHINDSLSGRSETLFFDDQGEIDFDKTFLNSNNPNSYLFLSLLGEGLTLNRSKTRFKDETSEKGEKTIRVVGFDPDYLFTFEIPEPKMPSRVIDFDRRYEKFECRGAKLYPGTHDLEKCEITNNQEISYAGIHKEDLLFGFGKPKSTLTFYKSGAIRSIIAGKKLKFSNGCKYKPNDTILLNEETREPLCK